MEIEIFNTYLTDSFNTYPILIYSIIITFSLLIGSFINMIIFRLPLMLYKEWHEECCSYLNLDSKKQQTDLISEDYTNISISYPQRSICTNCKNTIALYDNIPIISFLILKAKCRNCEHPIPWRYPIIEFLSLASSLLIIYSYGFNITSISIILLTYILIIIAAIDFEHYLIPDNLNYIGLWLGLLINTTNYGLINIENSVYGAITGYLFLWSIYWVFKLIRGKEGFGHGDFKLAALFGAWIGASNILPMLILASVIAIIFNIINYIVNYTSLKDSDYIQKPFPFGPYLVFSGWIVLLLMSSYNSYNTNILNLLL